MDMSIASTVLLSAFAIAFVMGATANKTNFCTMGAVSDMVNMGDTGRFRAWIFAMLLAIAGVLILQASGIIDTRLAVSGDSSFPPYRTAMFAWPRYLVGGLLFGIGMTLGSGCGNKTLVRLGGGNIKSLFVLICMGIGAYLMMYTNFMGNVFLSWMQPLFIDLASHGVTSQGLGDMLAGSFMPDAAQTGHYIIGVVLVLALLFWVLRSDDFRGRFDNILGGGVMGLGVIGGWFVSAGSLGQSWMEEADFMDQPPLHVGAQSYTFVSPSGDLINLAMNGFSQKLISFGLTAALGVILGSLLFSLVARSFRIEWFSSMRDAFNHIVGGLLMGIGGVLGMGCTIGQGITGASTLVMGSFIAFGAIVLGSGLTMKVQYYKLLHEDATFLKALTSSLVDFKLLPSSMRSLESY